ncbi:MAG: energy transducer TonB [Gammaproteobacteria bacterium]|nr:energy transducer TonB [Gammaproteobacteria bacterium]
MRHFSNSHLTLAGFIGISLSLHGVLLLNTSSETHEISIPSHSGSLSVALVQRPNQPTPTSGKPDASPIEKSAEVVPSAASVAKGEISDKVEKFAQTEKPAKSEIDQREQPAKTDAKQATQAAQAATSTRASNEIKRELTTRLQTHFEYPILAVRRGWQGDVQLSFRVLSNGNLINIRVARSSGYALLDHSALEALRRVNHVRETIHWMHQDHLDLTLPVRYQLKEG